MTATQGKKVINLSTTLTTAGTQQTILKDGVVACKDGKLFISNPNIAGNIWLGLAGEANLSSVTPIGWWLAPGAGLIIDDPMNNPITAVSDTSGIAVTIYGVPS